jgi:glycosyltransferase involved in cell wall biosynthesis
MPIVSVCFITIRSQPHFDWLFAGLGQQTFKDFEVIIIDDRESMERYKEARILAAKNNIVMGYYGKSKPGRWTGKRPALCNARNTAIVVANGKYLVFHDDNGIANPDWIGRHMQWGQYGYDTAGTWHTYSDGDVKDGKFEGTGTPYGIPSESRARNWPKDTQAMPAPGIDWLQGGNMGFPLQAALEANGFDEDYDGEQGVDDCDFSIRTRRLGYKTIFDPGCVVTYCTKTHANTQDEAVKTEEKGGRGLEKIARKPKEHIVKRDGQMHFANEFLIEQLLEGKRPLKANSNFDIERLRKEYRETLEIKHPLGPEKDWRDGEDIASMV